jgi:hypothetical protein
MGLRKRADNLLDRLSTCPQCEHGDTTPVDGCECRDARCVCNPPANH